MPQLMESYPQLIPNITKVVEPLKAYKGRHSHGEEEENNQQKYCHSDHGSFEQGVGQGGLGEVVATASTDCKYLFNVLINICLAYFLQVCVLLHMLVYYG
jgi:hypothetical protein